MSFKGKNGITLFQLLKRIAPPTAHSRQSPQMSWLSQDLEAPPS